MQVIINVPQILVWPVQPYSMSLLGGVRQNEYGVTRNFHLYAKNEGTHGGKINIFIFCIEIGKVKVMTLLL